MRTVRMMVIGDPHAHPRYDNDRFLLLGKVARKLRATHVHCVGDWTDWPSLSAHKTKRELLTANYEADRDAGNDALQRFSEGLDHHPCKKTISLGNHDMYPDRYVEQNDPMMEGVISWKDVMFRSYGWGTSNFKEEANHHGFVCSHYFPSGEMGRAQGGMHVAHHNVMKQGDSVIFGHNHRLDIKVRTYGERRKIWGFSAGCMTHPSYNEPWCRNTVHNWDRGVLMLTIKGNKLQSFSWYSLEAMVKL